MIMEFIKKQTIATWITLGTVILTIVALVLCGNNSSEGYFAALLNQGNWMSLLIWSLVLEIIYLVLVQVNVEGVAGTAVKFVGDLLKIVIAVLLISALVSFLGTRVEGLGYILFPEETVRPEVQTEVNMASANGAITATIMIGVAWLVALVASFFGSKKA